MIDVSSLLVGSTVGPHARVARRFIYTGLRVHLSTHSEEAPPANGAWLDYIWCHLRYAFHKGVGALTNRFWIPSFGLGCPFVHSSSKLFLP